MVPCRSVLPLLTQVIINGAPGAPAAPTATATLQPTCRCSNRNHHLVTAPLGATLDLLIAIDGTIYPGFTNI